MIGFVYLLTNSYFQLGVYKLGCTERSPHLRAQELSKSTGVPHPFTVRCYIEVDDFQGVEKHLHQCLKEFRISAQREFFSEGLSYAVRLMYWYPQRLAFCEPLLAGQGYSELTHPFTGEFVPPVSSLAETDDPWQPKRVVAKPVEELSFAQIVAMDTEDA